MFVLLVVVVVGLRQSRTTMESALGGFTACGTTTTMAEQADAGVTVSITVATSVDRR